MVVRIPDPTAARWALSRKVKRDWECKFAPRVCVLILRGLRGSPNSPRDRELLSESLTILLLSLRPPNNSGILRTTRRRAGRNFGRRIFSALPIGHDHLVYYVQLAQGTSKLAGKFHSQHAVVRRGTSDAGNRRIGFLAALSAGDK